MHRLFKQALFALCSFNLLFNILHGSSFEDQKKAKMIQDLDVIRHHFEVGYAPTEWKKEHADWDIKEAFEHSKNKIQASSKITTKDFQQIVRDFMHSMHDYHVGVLFLSTENASLPFSVKGVGGRFFIDWIDPLRLPPSLYDIKVGDELIKFGGRPIAEIIEELKSSVTISNPQTDQGLAEIKLTQRLGKVGDSVPKGSIIIQTRSAAMNKMSSYQLTWSYTPEHVKNPLDFLQSLNFFSNFLPEPLKKPKIKLPQVMMINPLHQLYAKKVAGHDGGLGARKSFIPLLGTPLWINDDNDDDSSSNEDEDDDDFFGSVISWYAYTYQSPHGHIIGYVRIPHYLGYRKDVKEFGKIIQFMEENTDALIIDQVHNFGGSVLFLYELATMLATEPLITPHHRIKITQKEALEAYEILKIFELIELIFSSDSNDEIKVSEDGEEKGEEEDTIGLGINYQQLLILKAYYELILEEWNAGHTLTQSTPILGVDMIHPNSKCHYTKPILMLIN